MNYKYYKEYNEHVYHKELNNGLNVYLIPKKEFHKTFVTFTTKYGAQDTTFVPIGRKNKVTQPAGIAHFLEHKLFEMPDGTDAFETLSGYGVNANAFTNFEKTSYLFSGTDNIKESLVYLLDFVQTPHFTEASVKKEQGIIEEELLMYQDYPTTRLFYGLLANMYKSDQIKTEVIGTKESIYEITYQQLYQAYNTFYHPSNMKLIVVGNFDENEIIKLVEENQNKKNYQKVDPIIREVPKEPYKIVKDFDSTKMSIQTPYIGVGVKLRPEEDKIDQLKSYYTLQLLLDIYFAQSSDNYEYLLKKGLVDKSFSYEAGTTEHSLAIFINVMTDRTDEFVDEVTKMLVNLKRKNINDEVFLRMKRGFQGLFIKNLNTIENINLSFLEAIDHNFSLFDVPELIESITKEDVLKLAKQIKKDVITTYIVYPEK